MSSSGGGFLSDGSVPGGVSGNGDLDPVEAFDALADETRLAILRALADRRQEAPERPTLSFSELRERVGVRDSGLFNYHLSKLVGRFVRERPEGYELGHAGRRVIRADGHGDPGDGEEAASEACPVCGETDCERSIHVHLRAPWS